MMEKKKKTERAKASLCVPKQQWKKVAEKRMVWL